MNEKDEKWALDTIDELVKFIISIGQYAESNIVSIDQISYRVNAIKAGLTPPPMIEKLKVTRPLKMFPEQVVLDELLRRTEDFEGVAVEKGTVSIHPYPVGKDGKTMFVGATHYAGPVTILIIKRKQK